MNNKEAIFCPNCGAKNSVKDRFCYNCGAPLHVTGSIGDTKEHSSIKDKLHFRQTDHIKVISLVIVGALLLIALIGNICQNYYVKHQNEEIRTCVYSKFSKEDFDVHIDRNNKEIDITPSSSQGAIIMDADTYVLDDYKDSVVSISKKIKDNVGEGWTVNVENPFNTKRTLWLAKDGILKYALSYDSDDY